MGGTPPLTHPDPHREILFMKARRYLPILTWLPLGLTSLLLATMVAAAADPTIAGPPQPAETGHLLRYQFQPGETVSARVAHRAVTETTVNGTTQSVETATDSVKSWKVTGVDEDGQTTIEHSVDDVTMTSRTSGEDVVRWESDSNAPAPSGYEGVRLSLGRPLSRLTLDPCGRVLNRRDLFPSPPSNTGDLMVVPLPDEPVTEGSSWTVPEEIVIDIPGGPRRSIRTRLRYRVASIQDNIAVIHVDTTVLTPIDDPRIESRLLERIWDGQIDFDIGLGRVIRRQTSVDRRVVGFHGPTSSVRYKASLEEELITR